MMCREEINAGDALFERFLQMEEKYDCMHMRIGEFYFWQYCRFFFFNNVILPRYVKFGDAHPDINHSSSLNSSHKTLFSRLIRSILKRYFRLYCFLFRNAEMSFKKRPILFSLSPRMMSVDERGNVPIMLDFIVDGLKTRYAVLQHKAFTGKYVRLPKQYRVFWLSEPSKKRVALIKHRLASCDFSESISRESQRVVKILGDTFNVKIKIDEINQIVVDSVRIWLGHKEEFRSWLKHLGVKCLVLSVAYDTYNMLLSEVAHELGITVVELQHGLIYPAHIGYNAVKSHDLNRPDYLFIWGSLWRKGLRNYPRIKALETGYPFFDYALKRYPRRHREDNKIVILFISQGTIGEQLSRIAVNMADELSSEYEVRYKLHPSETNSWRTIYPWLNESKVLTIDNNKTNIYSELSESDLNIGVNSTALIEGFAYGTKALIIGDCLGAKTMEHYCQLGFSEYVVDVKDIAKQVIANTRTRITLKYSTEELFKSDAVKNVVNAINAIVEGGAL